jgi:transposase
VRTYAPRGETPLLKVFEPHDHLSVISGITTTGKLATWQRGYALKSADSIAFLRHLSAYLGRKLLGVWDGATLHRSREVREFLAQGWAEHIHLEPFPAYAPELNPDERVWRHLKHVELRNPGCQDLTQRGAKLDLAIRRIRSRSEFIRSLFSGAKLDL